MAYVALLVLAGWASRSAEAADSIYWANFDFNSNAIAVANLDGSGSASSLFNEGPGTDPLGVAIDPAASRIYWADQTAGTIRVANLDGSGTPSTLFSGESYPGGVEIDPAANKIYWADIDSGTIRVANLDGSGTPSTLFTERGGSDPTGVAIDPAANKIYWTDQLADTIRVGNLDGSGSASTLFTEGGGPLVVGDDPVGVAIDPASSKIYWTDAAADRIRVANLDGSGTASTLFTEASGSVPGGVAIDPEANKIYWANLHNAIRVANLDGSGTASTLWTDDVSSPVFIALLLSPVATAPPGISGKGRVGKPLSCSPGSWAPNLLGAFNFRAPHSVSYQWQKGDADVPGGTAKSYKPRVAGTYSCRETATNLAGPSSQTSAVLSVGHNPKCRQLRRKLRHQHSNLTTTVNGKKRSMIQGNIPDTKKRLKKLTC